MRSLASIRILGAFILWSCTHAYPQVPVRVGIGTGINIANTDPRPESLDSRTRIGLIASTIIEWQFWDSGFLQAEPRYIQKGRKDRWTSFDASGQISTGDELLKLDYLEIPLLFKATFGSGVFKPFLFFGPSIAVLLSARSVSTEWGSSRLNYFKPIDLCIEMGAGGEYLISPKVSIFVDARYSRAIDGSSLDGDIVCTGIQVLGGVLFTL